MMMAIGAIRPTKARPPQLRTEEYGRRSTRPKPTDSPPHSNQVAGAYLGTTEPYLRAMASAGARRYQSIQQDGMQAMEPDPSRQLQDKVGGVMPAGLFLLMSGELHSHCRRCGCWSKNASSAKDFVASRSLSR